MEQLNRLNNILIKIKGDENIIYSDLIYADGIWSFLEQTACIKYL